MPFLVKSTISFLFLMTVLIRECSLIVNLQRNIGQREYETDVLRNKVYTPNLSNIYSIQPSGSVKGHRDVSKFSRHRVLLNLARHKKLKSSFGYNTNNARIMPVKPTVPKIFCNASEHQQVKHQLHLQTNNTRAKHPNHIPYVSTHEKQPNSKLFEAKKERHHQIPSRNIEVRQDYHVQSDNERMGLYQRASSGDKEVRQYNRIPYGDTKTRQHNQLPSDEADLIEYHDVTSGDTEVRKHHRIHDSEGEDYHRIPSIISEKRQSDNVKFADIQMKKHYHITFDDQEGRQQQHVPFHDKKNNKYRHQQFTNTDLKKHYQHVLSGESYVRQHHHTPYGDSFIRQRYHAPSVDDEVSKTSQTPSFREKNLRKHHNVNAISGDIEVRDRHKYHYVPSNKIDIREFHNEPVDNTQVIKKNGVTPPGHDLLSLESDPRQKRFKNGSLTRRQYHSVSNSTPNTKKQHNDIKIPYLNPPNNVKPKVAMSTSDVSTEANQEQVIYKTVTKIGTDKAGNGPDKSNIYDYNNNDYDSDISILYEDWMNDIETNSKVNVIKSDDNSITNLYNNSGKEIINKPLKKYNDSLNFSTERNSLLYYASKNIENTKERFKTKFLEIRTKGFNKIGNFNKPVNKKPMNKKSTLFYNNLSNVPVINSNSVISSPSLRTDIVNKKNLITVYSKSTQISAMSTEASSLYYIALDTTENSRYENDETTTDKNGNDSNIRKVVLTNLDTQEGNKLDNKYEIDNISDTYTLSTVNMLGELPPTDSFENMSTNFESTEITPIGEISTAQANLFSTEDDYPNINKGDFNEYVSENGNNYLLSKLKMENEITEKNYLVDDNNVVGTLSKHHRYSMKNQQSTDTTELPDKLFEQQSDKVQIDDSYNVMTLTTESNNFVNKTFDNLYESTWTTDSDIVSTSFAKDINESDDSKFVPSKNYQVNSFVIIDKINNMEYNDDDYDDTKVAETLAKEVRVLCGVIIFPENVESKAVHVRDTWGKKCNVFLGFNSDDAHLPSAVNPVHGFYLWNKTKTAFNYMYDNHLKDADWFLHTHEDTYFVIENLRHLLSKYMSSDLLYLGHRFQGVEKKPKQGYMSGSAGYILSRAALYRFKTLGLELGVCEVLKDGYEDNVMGLCMEKLGVSLIDTRDSMDRMTFMPLKLTQHFFSLNMPTWYWTYEYYAINEGFTCCSDRAISFHYVNATLMYEYDYLINVLRPYGINFSYDKH